MSRANETWVRNGGQEGVAKIAENAKGREYPWPKKQIDFLGKTRRAWVKSNRANGELMA